MVWRDVPMQYTQRAAAILHEDVTNVINEATTLPWPPTIESLKSDARNPPAILALFYNNLLSAAKSHHVASSTTDRYVASFSQDAMHAVSNGDFVTLKHATLGLGLHSLTGQKLPLVVVKTWPFYQLRSNLRNRNRPS